MGKQGAGQGFCSHFDASSFHRLQDALHSTTTDSTGQLRTPTLYDVTLHSTAQPHSTALCSTTLFKPRLYNSQRYLLLRDVLLLAGGQYSRLPPTAYPAHQTHILMSPFCPPPKKTHPNGMHHVLQVPAHPWSLWCNSFCRSPCGMCCCRITSSRASLMSPSARPLPLRTGSGPCNATLRP